MKQSIWQLSLVVVAAVLPVTALAEPTDARQCDANAVVYCGAYTPTELAFKIEHGDGHNATDNLGQVLYQENRGITPEGIDSSVDGEVASDGRVIVGGKVVATGARIASRDQGQDGEKNGSLYLRPAADFAASATVPALVDMTDGSYHWAILKQNGDPVVATAGVGSGDTATPAPATPTPTPATPTPTPSSTPASPTPSPETPQSTPTTVPDTGGTGEALPETGPETMLGGAAGLTSLGLVGSQYLRSRRNLKAAMRRR